MSSSATSDVRSPRSHKSSRSRENVSSPRSPPRPPSRRRPLQERGASQNNSDARPTIRVVGSPESQSYDKSPFPSQPSQVLSPSRYGRESRFDDQGPVVSGASSRTPSTNTLSTSPAPTRVASMVANYESLRPKPLQPTRSNRNSSSTRDSDVRNSDASTLTLGAPFTPSSSRFSQGTTPPTSPLSQVGRDKHDSLGAGSLVSVLQDDKPAPAGRTIRPVIPSSSTVIHEPASGPSERPAPTPEPDRDSIRPVYPSASTATNESARRHSEASTQDYDKTPRPSETPPSSRADDSFLSRVWELASSASGETETYSRRRNDRKSSATSVVHRPSELEQHSSSSGSPNPPTEYSIPSSQRTVQYRPRSRSEHQLRPKASYESLRLSSGIPSVTASPDRPRSASSPAPNWSLHGPAAELDDGASLSYPLIRPPSASGSWADSRPLPKNPSRMQERSPMREKWSSQLSTIDSASEPRTSHSLSSILTLGLGQSSRRRQSLGSIDQLASADLPSTPSESSVPVPRPLFSVTPARHDGDFHGEGEDTLGELNNLPLRQQRSGLLRPESAHSRPESASSQRSSYTSQFLDTVPQWARVYYRNSPGDRASFPGTATPSDTSSPRVSRVNTMASGTSRSPTEYNFPQNVWRPRTRPLHNRHSSLPSSRNSLSISEAPYRNPSGTSIQRTPEPGRSQENARAAPPPVPAKDSTGAPIGTRTRQSVEGYQPKPGTRQSRGDSFVPRLRPDRRSTGRLSIWTVPSMSEPIGTLFFSTHNRQLLLFCAGFVLPLAWMLAAVLPLPTRPGPGVHEEKGKSRATTPGSFASGDVERALAAKDAEAERALMEKRWNKARWWRRLNRYMSVLGVAIIVVVVVVAVVQAK